MNEPTDGAIEPSANPVTPESTEVSPPVPPPSDAIPPLLPPPSPVAWDVPQLKSQRTPVLAIVTGATGLLQVILAIIASGRGGHVTDYSYRIGSVLGSTVIWPLIIIGLFSFGRSFRTTSRRMKILLTVWGLFVLAYLGAITAPNKNSATASSRAKKTTWSASQIDPSSVKFVVPPLRIAPDALRGNTAVDDGEVSPFDFSPGSDKRLIASIDGAQKERYQAIVAAYIKACARHQGDAVLALEMVRFVERFAFSEDSVIEQAAADHEVAVKYLKSQFPDAPGTVLYLLEESGGEERETLAKTYERLLDDWSPQDRAAFLLLRAQAEESTSPGRISAVAYARESFALNPTVAAGLLLAEELPEKSGDVERLKILTDPVFDAAEPWSKRQKLLLLLKMREADKSVELYAKLRAESANLVTNTEIADGLAKVGRIDSAREIFTDLTDQKWGREAVNLRRFAFELAHGNREQTVSAYRTMRATGPAADPFLRYRTALFMKYPGVGWNREDVVGALILSFSVVGMILVPLLFLVPAHYWSLIRATKGKCGGWVDAQWGLRHAWFLLGAMMLLDFVVIWLVQPETMRSWVTSAEAESDILPLPSILFLQSVYWFLMSLVLLWLFWRGRSWRLVGAGRWSVIRCVGAGVGAAFVVRMLLVFALRIWPEMVTGEVAAALNQTQRIMTGFLNQCGPWGLLGIAAVFVPLFEEVLFRGVVLQALGKHIPFGWANLGQALMFGLVHENYRMLPFYIVLGLVAGSMTRKSGGLLPGYIMHSCNNALACMAIISSHRLG